MHEHAKVEKYRNRWLIVAVDLLVVMGVVGVVVMAVMVLGIRAFLASLEEQAAVQLASLKSHAHELDALGEKTGQLDAEVRQRISDALDVVESTSNAAYSFLENLRGAGGRIMQWEEVRAQILSAGTQTADAYMRAWGKDRDEYWAHIAGSLCDSPGSLLDLSTIGYTYTPHAYLEALAKFDDFQRRIWRVEMECTQERIFVINEDLLRFTVNQYKEFDMSDEQRDEALNRIYQIVDQQTRDGRRRILISGHCDERGGKEHNYRLSFNRAMFVRNMVVEHLTRRGWKEGRDFWTTLIGYGKTVPVPRNPHESDALWWGRCRRIELAFQKVGRRQAEIM